MKPQSSRSPFVLLGVVGVLFLLYMLLPSEGYTNGGVRAGGLSAHAKLKAIPARSEFLIVSDLDKRSAIEGKKPRWKAVLKKGALNYDASGQKYSVDWLSEVVLSSGHGEEGRGMELSELIMWNNRLYTMDDRSGIVYEVVDYASDKARVVPRYILMEGDGNTEKGFKGEWGTVKDGKLIISSFGKEYANSDGTIKNLSNNWIAEITPEGRITYVDWSNVYNAMRKATGHEFPAYILHEAGIWSDIRQQWVFLPRRMCKTPYDEVEDERMGANTVFLLNEQFQVQKTFTVGAITPERGFSTAKFVPGSRDNVLLVLKSAEYSATDRQTSYISVLSMDGKELMPETEIAGDMKYEGLEFL